MSDIDLEGSFREAREFVARVLALSKRSLARWPVWLVAILLTGPATWAAPRLRPAVYESQAVLMYRETLQTESLVGQQHGRESWTQMNRRFIDTVLSRTNLEVIVEELKLYPEIVRKDGMLAAYEEMRRQANVEAPPGSTLVVRFRGEDPVKVEAVVTRLAELLRKQPGRDAAARAEGTRRFLESQAAMLGEHLGEKERVLSEFVALNPEFAVDELETRGARVGAMTRAAGRKPPQAERSARIATLARQADRLTQRLDGNAVASKPPPGGDRLPDPDPVTVAAERAVVEAASRLSSLRAEFTDRYPDVIKAREQLAEARAELIKAKTAAQPRAAAPSREPPRPVANDPAVESKLKVVNAALRAEQSAANDKPARRNLDSMVTLEMRWVSLNREVDSAREQYESVERKLFQASILAKVESSGGDGELFIVDPAHKPQRPVARGPMRTRILAFTVCLMAAALVAFALTLLDDRIYGEHELRSLKLAPIVHSVPHCGTAQEVTPRV